VRPASAPAAQRVAPAEGRELPGREVAHEVERGFYK
jgi:hypothetical protein